MKTKIPSLISILVLTLITALMWVGLSVYRMFTTEVSPTVDKAILEPLNPELDSEVILQMQERIFLNESEIPQTQIITNSPTTPAESTTPTLPPEEEPIENPAPTEPGQEQ